MLSPAHCCQPRTLLPVPHPVVSPLRSGSSISLGIRRKTKFKVAKAGQRTPEEDVRALQGGGLQESLSEEASAQVADLVDTDRTGELLVWLWSSMFQREKHTSSQVPEVKPHLTLEGPTEMCVLGAGCYWTLDACFRRIKGVLRVQTGFAGGHLEQPSYKKVCAGDTGHAEVVRIEFKPDLVSYAQLLTVLRDKMDLDLKTKGSAVYSKPQYRPIVLHSSDAQQEDTKLVLSNSNPGNGVEIGSLTHFWPAAPRHQEFYENNITNTYCTREITPVLKSLSELHPSLFLVDREDE